MPGGCGTHVDGRAASRTPPPVPYFHVVFTLPAPIGDIAYTNKAVDYDLLFQASAETMITIALDPKHLGARIAITSVLRTWGSAMTHHPRVHMIMPGGGLSSDGSRWIATKPNFLLPFLVLSKLFRRLMLEKLTAARAAGKFRFFGAHANLADQNAFATFPAPLQKRTRWFVHSKLPFAGLRAVLAYLSRYTHRVAISNSRLIAADANGRQGQGLPRGTGSLHNHDARGGGVYPSLPATCPPQVLPPPPALRSACRYEPKPKQSPRLATSSSQA